MRYRLQDDRHVGVRRTSVMSELWRCPVCRTTYTRRIPADRKCAFCFAGLKLVWPASNQDKEPNS